MMKITVGIFIALHSTQTAADYIVWGLLTPSTTSVKPTWLCSTVTMNDSVTIILYSLGLESNSVCVCVCVCSISGSFHAANTLAVDCQGTYCVIPTQSFQAPLDNAYTIGFSQAPVYNNPHAYPHTWKDSGYSTSIPKARNTMQTFSHHTGTLPSYFAHQKRQSAAGLAGIQEHNQDITTVATISEVATIL